jgi:hypothetical protein
MHRYALGLAFVVIGCAHPAPTVARPVASTTPAESDRSVVTWSTLRAEIEATMCVRRHEIEGREPVDVPEYGDRIGCGLAAPATPIERSVASAFVDAKPVLISLREERDAAFAAVRGPAEERTTAVRRAYMTDVFLVVLLPRLHAALAREELRCTDCPELPLPRQRELTWETFEPYLHAHIWADPVKTPRDARGRPAAAPQVSGHVCGGLNGVSRLADPDPLLVRTGFLAAIHTQSLLEGASAVLQSLAKEREFEAQPTDEARTEYLRARFAPRVLELPGVRDDVCATLARFERDTGVVVTDCRP